VGGSEHPRLTLVLISALSFHRDSFISFVSP